MIKKYLLNIFPPDQISNVRQLSEVFVRDIRREDFDKNKLYKNRDGMIDIQVEGNEGASRKKVWLIDGGRLQEI